MESVFSMAAITFWALCAAGIAWYASEVAKDVTYVTLADGELGFVKVEIEDDDGTVLPLAKDRVNFKLEGPGEIVAVGNGSHNGLDSFAETSSHPLYYGRALVVVRRTGGSGLPLKLTASAPSVRSATVTLGRK